MTNIAYHKPQRIVVEKHDEALNEWPEAGLDIISIKAAGWRATPVQEYVIKLSSRCNLACDHCYIYKMNDQSWRKRPAFMSSATLEQTGHRIAEHTRMHGLSQIRVVLHGGEPLLGGPSLIGYAASVIRRHLTTDVDLNISIQTNGILLNDRIMQVMHAHRIKIGLSLDGTAEHHDRHRKVANGSGSYFMAERAVQLLSTPANRELFAGLLCTIDLENDPTEVYDALIGFTPPMLDFLLPHGTWSSPPPGRDREKESPYGKWLSIVFDRWHSDVNGVIRIRLFEEIIRLLLGRGSRSDQVGLSPVAFLIVDTDGSLQQTDALKAAYAGAPETGLNVFDHAVDEALAHPAVIARQLGLAALADECIRCKIVAVCGGGHYPHRYRHGVGFRNPSVYCPDLQTLIYHISRRLSRELAL